MREKLEPYKEFLDKTRIPIRIACKMKNGWPTVVSLWYMHSEGRIYCATQKRAKIVDYLLIDNRCGFEIAEDLPPYCGIRGQAEARIDSSLGPEVLQKLLVRYLGDIENPLARKLLAKRDSEVAIILEPSRIFTWDYSDRMRNLNSIDDIEKVCP